MPNCKGGYKIDMAKWIWSDWRLVQAAYITADLSSRRLCMNRLYMQSRTRKIHIRSSWCYTDKTQMYYA